MSRLGKLEVEKKGTVGFPIAPQLVSDLLRIRDAVNSIDEFLLDTTKVVNGTKVGFDNHEKEYENHVKDVKKHFESAEKELKKYKKSVQDSIDILSDKIKFLSKPFYERWFIKLKAAIKKK